MERGMRMEFHFDPEDECLKPKWYDARLWKILIET